MIDGLREQFPNRAAFLDMTATSELTKALLDASDNGYNVEVGATATHPILFDSYDDHPRKEIWLPHLGVYSSAAGRYQIKISIFVFSKVRLNLPDFSPDSQDAIALRLIRECHALEEIDAGNVCSAIMLCASRWASFPTSSYGQHEQTFGTLKAAFVASGGKLLQSEA